MLLGVKEVILYVRDMASMVHYYRDVLGLRVRSPHGFRDFHDIHWAELDTGACTLVLHAGGEGRQGEDAPKFVFSVEDVKAARMALLERGVRLGEVRSPAPGVLVCDGVDPEGNRFSIESI